jgi:predicted secreted protein
MSKEIGFAISIYFIIWWLLLFCILPIGVRSQSDEGKVIPGTAESAPVKMHFLLKLLATTVLTSIVFTFVYLIVFAHVISLDSIPFLPHFDKIQ